MRDRKFRKSSSKIFIENVVEKSKKSKIFDLKKFQMSISSCSNFLHFQNKLMIFFMDQCSFSVRRRWRHLERSNNELGRIKRKSDTRVVTRSFHLQQWLPARSSSVRLPMCWTVSGCCGTVSGCCVECVRESIPVFENVVSVWILKSVCLSRLRDMLGRGLHVVSTKVSLHLAFW